MHTCCAAADCHLYSRTGNIAGHHVPLPPPTHPPTHLTHVPAACPPQEDRPEMMDEIQQAYGWEEPDTNGRDDDDVTRALEWHELEIEAAAAAF